MYTVICKLQISSLKYVKSYLENEQERVNTNNNFISREKTHKDVPQDYILAPLFI